MHSTSLNKRQNTREFKKKNIFLDHSFSVEIDRASDVLLKVNL